jgi:hypothetical protein
MTPFTKCFVEINYEAENYYPIYSLFNQHADVGISFWSGELS